MKYRGWARVLLALFLLAAVLGREPGHAKGAPGDRLFTYLPLIRKPPALQCRFGITTRSDAPGYADAAHLKQLKSGSLIDWGNQRIANLDREITYLHVIRTRNPFDWNILTKIPSLVQTYPGAYWQIGNEPDTCYESQDCTLPKDYAARYYAVASALKANDPYAKIGFGSVVQPTPIRLVYLDRAWTELVGLAGGQGKASALVDFWSIHSFILNEKPLEWGTGIPPGVSELDAPLFLINLDFAHGIDETWKTYDAALFQQRIREFRAWMNVKGERNKALWITEYGSLFPPADPPGGPNLVNVSDADTLAFMISSFDFLRTTTDAGTGMPGDGNRLVQRWFWYSMNDYRYSFGGTLFDPETGASTAVGQAYIAYTAPLPPETDCKP